MLGGSGLIKHKFMQTLFIILLLLIYFLPSILAFKNNKYNPWKVVLFNILLGWTVFGWIIALALAVKSPEDNL